jgi:hypothetical protein
MMTLNEWIPIKIGEYITFSGLFVLLLIYQHISREETKMNQYEFVKRKYRTLNELQGNKQEYIRLYTHSELLVVVLYTLLIYSLIILLILAPWR